MGKKAPTKAVEEEKPQENDKAEEKEAEEKEVEEKEAEEKEAEDAEEKEEDEEEVKPVENGVKEKKGKKKEVDSKKSEKGGKKKGKEEDDKEKDDKEKDDKEKDDKEKDDKDEGESSEEELGTLEKPIEILTSKRDRKSTERFVPPKKEKKDEDDVDYTEGKGVVLGDIPFIKYKISDADAEDLEVIHKLMYRKTAKLNQLKRNILKFQGFPFGKDHKYYKSAHSMAERLTIPGVRWINGTLGLLKSKDKEEMTDALLEFIMEPKDLELEVPAKKIAPKSKKSSRRGKRTPKRAAKDPKKKVTDSDDEDEEDDVSEASSNEDESEEEEKPAKKSPAKKTAKKKATPVKISLPSKKRGRGKSAPSESDSDEDDEPLVKKKKATPTDAELKKAVSSILKDADLEEVTMKNVVRQVYDKYPSFDLSSRKDYIKSTVKQMIS